jgi:hypothetical protein
MKKNILNSDFEDLTSVEDLKILIQTFISHKSNIPITKHLAPIKNVF